MAATAKKSSEFSAKMLKNVCHPSVRIRGTENNYNPVPCLDNECPNRTIPHMHCPFCTKTEAFQDPVILKAHYRVKHVDKGVDFSGLKVLRCCDSCEIVGVIKGEKRFKGAHWHCYRCRNGFNRRDEAIKHYNTHFRNPETTFQIQVAQEVNQNYSSYNPLCQENVQRITTLTQEEIIKSQDVQQAVLSITNAEAALDTSTTTTTLSNGARVSLDGATSVVGAQETVRSCADTIMIIDEKLGQENVTFLTGSLSDDYNISYEDWFKERSELKRKLAQATSLNHRLESEVRAQKRQINQLKIQLAVHEDTIVSQRKREHEIVEQLSTTSVPTKVQQLLEALRQDHEQLLSNHLVCVRDAVISQLSESGSDSSQSLLKQEQFTTGQDANDIEFRTSQDSAEMDDSKAALVEAIEQEPDDGLGAGEASVEVLVPEGLEIVEADDGEEKQLFVVGHGEPPAKKFCH